MRAGGAFDGFSQKSLDFLRELEANNNKPWFEEHKHVYRDFLLQPMQRLVADLSDFMLTIDPYFETAPAVGKTISRIYRDTRFSKDKSPFRSSIWFTFKRPSAEWQDAPAYFFELSPRSYRFGMGFYSASKTTMDTFREMIDTRPDEFRRAISFYPKQRYFTVEGDRYKKVLDPEKPADILEWYQRKNLYLVCNRAIDHRLFSPELVRDLTEGFGLLADFYRFLLSIKEKKGAGFHETGRRH